MAGRVLRVTSPSGVHRLWMSVLPVDNTMRLQRSGARSMGATGSQSMGATSSQSMGATSSMSSMQWRGASGSSLGAAVMRTSAPQMEHR